MRQVRLERATGPRDLPGTDEQPLIFDYTLLPGIATSTNALKLMELMGLAPHDSDAPT